MGKAQVPPTNPQVQANLTTKALQTKVQFTDLPANNGKQGNMTWSPSFVLQRLACPALPPSQFNPYVTTDYWESDPTAVNNRLKYDDQGNTNAQAMNAGDEPDFNTSYSWGRRQPYDGVIIYTLPNAYRQAPKNVQMGQVNFTLGQHNGTTAEGQNTWPNVGDATLQLPFVPLAHLDRIVLNPAELVNVAAVKPHEVTHEYDEANRCDRRSQRGANAGLTNNTLGAAPYGKLKYTVDWFDQANSTVATTPSGAMLYRCSACCARRPSWTER